MKNRVKVKFHNEFQQNGETVYVFELIGLTSQELAIHDKFRKSLKSKIYLSDDGNPKKFTNIPFLDYETLQGGLITKGKNEGDLWIQCAVNSKAKKFADFHGMDFYQTFNEMARRYKLDNGIQDKPTISEMLDKEEQIIDKSVKVDDLGD